MRDVIRYGAVGIETIEEGQGPAIVLLPSLGRDSEEFDPVAERLAADGIGHEPVETYSTGVRHVVVLDPDGNSLSLAEAPAR